MNEQFTGLNIGFIGGGVMGEAMIVGLLKQQTVAPTQIIASDPLPERGQFLQHTYGIRATTSNLDAAQSEILILSVKPQVLDKVLHDLHGQSESVRLVLSILAGATIAHIAEGLGNPHVVRAMPNTPARIGEGITVWTAPPEVGETERGQVRAILGTLGQEVYVDNEDYLDMATALSGTGPAYVFMFMEAMIDAGVHLGFSRRIAEQLVTQTVRGSVAYLEATKEHPAALRNQVTSPGGTTAEALYHLERGGLRTVIARAVWAAYQRSVALGAGKKPKPPSRNPEQVDGDR